jgi:hypothetical protein
MRVCYQLAWTATLTLDFSLGFKPNNTLTQLKGLMMNRKIATQLISVSKLMVQNFAAIDQSSWQI